MAMVLPWASAPAFAQQAPAAPAPLRRVFPPSMPRQMHSSYPWKTDIIADVTSIGKASAWDAEWQAHYGGPDPLDAKARAVSYAPAAFIPKLNPFYVALPYNDVGTDNQTKPEARTHIPWFNQRFTKSGKSVVEGRWLAIRYGNRVCYAQWQDCGPCGTDDLDYVFGNARPKNTLNHGDGISVSPAVRDYLGLNPTPKIDWRFADLNEVPDGPWRAYGNDNAFLRTPVPANGDVARRLQELRNQRDEYFRKTGSSLKQN